MTRARHAGAGGLAVRRARVPAFSLVEIMVVLGLVLGLVGSVVAYRLSGQRQSLALDFQATALQSIQLVLAALERDLSRLDPGPLAGTFSAPTPTRAMLLRCVPSMRDEPGLPLDGLEPRVQTVRWLFDPATHLVHRQGEPLRSAPLESVEFTYFPSRPGDPTPPYGDTLVVRLVAVPLEALGAANPRTPRVAFTATFHLMNGTINHLHEDWIGDR
jgi:type II secretory pathway pseudopilin PulG